MPSLAASGLPCIYQSHTFAGTCMCLSETEISAQPCPIYGFLMTGLVAVKYTLTKWLLGIWEKN